MVIGLTEWVEWWSFAMAWEEKAVDAHVKEKP